jgi:non-ribosomal peptide synthetase component F
MLTYGEFDNLTNRLARHLRGLGAGPGVVAATLQPRSPEFVCAALAVLKAAGAYLPVVGSSPTRPTLSDAPVKSPQPAAMRGPGALYGAWPP